MSTTLSPPALEAPPSSFRPAVPSTLAEAGIHEVQVESLICKYLLTIGSATGRVLARELCLPFGPFPELLRRMKAQQMVVYRDTAVVNDYVYTLTDAGRERAKRYSEECAYVGAAPVPFEDYLESVTAQSITHEQPKNDDLRRAFADLLISQDLFDQLGPAINSGRGMFLYGAPGNGKTSIAERITRCFGSTVWIPRVLNIDGQIVKLFDPTQHEAVEQSFGGLLKQNAVDERWVEVRRPTLVVGGELTMDMLEVQYSPATKICEAPLQLKSNCGTLLIDDFGRQRMAPIELLNRWIVPLEKRYDFLSLPSGKQVKVPFDQLIIFSTNLEPKHLVDEAFLRRIPYKINVTDPSEHQFCRLFEIFAPKLGFEFDPDALRYLIERYYRAVARPFRNCQPRDLLLQIRNYCIYNDRPLELKPEYFDFAAAIYFTVMEGSGTCARPVG